MNTLFANVKTYARDLLPKRYQVPTKYWYGRARRQLEREMTMLQHLVHRGDRAVDVGGNRGIYAYQLWRLGAAVEVFEPNPVCAAVLAAWAADKANIRVHQLALSSQQGTATLRIPVDGAGVEHDASASIEEGHEGGGRAEPVKRDSLDAFELDQVSLIKIDVEGHEYAVLEGARATLARCKPALLVEIEERHSPRPIREVFSLVEAQGYVGFFLNEGRFIGLSKFEPSVHQAMSNFGTGEGRYFNNFFFLHRDRLAAQQYPELAQMGARRE